MELYQLRYFEAIARHEHLHRAARELHVSPPALSRSLGLLEEELAASLFARVGRRLALTEKGRVFARRAREILAAVEDAATEVGRPGERHVTVAGREILLARYADRITTALQARAAKSLISVTFRTSTGEEAIRMAREGEADLVVCLEALPPDLATRVLDTMHSVTWVGKGHALYPRAKRGVAVPVEDVIEHDFVCPNAPIESSAVSAADGWRDDVFPRRRRFTTDSVHLIWELVRSGTCLAYLPSFFSGADVLPLAVSGCPYASRWTVRIGAGSSAPRTWASAVLGEVSAASGTGAPGGTRSASYRSGTSARPR
jgi:DNA-binding transcriptional LysR family regulator